MAPAQWDLAVVSNQKLLVMHNAMRQLSRTETEADHLYDA